jgi:hypothetical protein
MIAGLLVASGIALGAAVSPIRPGGSEIAAPLAQQVRVSDRLYFGRMRADGLVSEADWAAFLADEVTPRFPQGLTVWSANGQWRDSASRITREPTFILELVHPLSADDDTALRAIVAEYRRRFAQESVLWVRDRVNVID